MAALFLTEDDVRWLADMDLAIPSVEAAFVDLAEERAMHEPRHRVGLPGIQLHTLAGAVASAGYVGTKSYSTTRSGAQFLVTLWDRETGAPAAVIEGNLLGQLRTGAATAISCKYMARNDAAIVGCFGTGLQARMQLKAICAVRPVQRIEVYGREADRRDRFAAEMSELCNATVVGVHSPEEAAAEKDIVVCATTSAHPVFDGKVLDEGTHVCAVGSNYLTKAEIDTDTIRLADHIACDSLAACKLEAGDFVPALESGLLEWSRVRELSHVITGRETGRALPSDITLFKSVGLGLEDVALGAAILKKAREEKLGIPLPF